MRLAFSASAKRFGSVFIQLCSLLVLFGIPSAFASEIKVITSGAFADSLKVLKTAYEAQSTHTLALSFGSSMGGASDSIPARLDRGEEFDVVILAAPALEKLATAGFVESKTQTNLVASVIGAAVKAGAPKPDISTVEALKKTLLDAQSVAYSASASGTYLSTVLFEKLGVAERMSQTAKKIYSERVGTVIARGEAELGFQQVSELVSIPGIDLIGEIPAELQLTTIFSAGITKNTKEEEAAKDLIKFLASPEAAPTIQKAGLKPLLPALAW